jgi:beta-glucuronidase
VRSVWLERLPEDGRFDRVQVAPRRSAAGGWELLLSMDFSRIAPAQTLIRCVLGEEEIALVYPDASSLALSIPAGSPALWSPESPVLHRLQVELMEKGTGRVLDVFQQRTGFRTIECDGEDLLLNGEKIRLAGVNRHEFHPDFGPSLPLAVQVRDLEILRKLGANFIRISHYPADPVFLDLCDQFGFLVWEELSHWQPKEPDLASSAFVAASMQELEEMVQRDIHHPCVVLWGMLNEASTDAPAARPIVKMLVDRFRELDPSRPVSYASMTDDDVCLDLVDVISRNLYPGWYGGRLDAVAPAVRQVVNFLREKAPGKPILLSEFGAAAGAGVRSFEVRKWTEDYQAELLVRAVDSASAAGISGVCIWQYCDVRTSPEHGLDRFREYNNKGLVDEFRRPKAAFEPVSRALGRFLKPGAGEESVRPARNREASPAVRGT